ncbi:MAG: transcriptional regulator [Phycisphaeraceae bacterium]|nr:transcriptional regulator [Phycisphaeraceae bacterium]
MTENKPNTGGDNPAPAIDKLIHEPARFNIMAHLYVVESADFLFLMRQTGLTKGNLSSHMSKLEAAGYIDVEKEFVNKKPHTMLSLSDRGRQAFQDYRESMKRVLDELPE